MAIRGGENTLKKSPKLGPRIYKTLSLSLLFFCLLHFVWVLLFKLPHGFLRIFSKPQPSSDSPKQFPHWGAHLAGDGDAGTSRRARWRAGGSRRGDREGRATPRSHFPRPGFCRFFFRKRWQFQAQSTKKCMVEIYINILFGWFFVGNVVNTP